MTKPRLWFNIENPWLWHQLWYLPILTFESNGWHYCGRKCSPDPEHLILSDFLVVSRFTLQCLFCSFWHFRPFWLCMKVLCRNAWCHIFDGDLIFTFLYFNVVYLHICHRLGTGWLWTSHGSCWPLPGVVPCFVFRFLYICLVVPAREGCVAFHVIYMLYINGM